MTAPGTPAGKKCPDCGTLNPLGTDFCSKCAHPIAGLSAETQIPNHEARAAAFAEQGAWLDKSLPETDPQKPDPPKLPNVDAVSEVELAYDPIEVRKARQAAAEAERAAWDRAHPNLKPEFTLRAVLVGVVVALFIGASYPYVVLKLGFGPNISVVSAFFGYLALLVLGVVMTKITGKDHRSSRVEYNIVQTAGSAAGQSAFMCILLAAFDILASRPALNFHLQPTPLQVFLWLSIAGNLGVLLAVPLRKHYIDQENLTFADGVAAGETLLVLDEGRSSAKRQLRWLLFGTVFSAVFAWFRNGEPKFIPETYFGPKGSEALRVGFGLSPLSFGSGLLVGLRITASMALGMVVAWFILPKPLADAGLTSALDFTETLKWVMWPATGLLVAAGITSLALKWRLILRTFQELKGAGRGSSDLPLVFVVGGSVVLAVALVVQQKLAMGISVFDSIAAIVISIPLMLVGVRVFGETNWAPVSSMANMVQGLFAFISPGNVAVNMVASGMSGTVAAGGEQIMQDYKAGKIVGSNNRYLTYMQLIATPIGAAALAFAYPMLKHQYGIGPDRYGFVGDAAHAADAGLTSPISMKWAGFAELLIRGVSALPKYALTAMVIGAVLGVVIAIFEQRAKGYLPSPTGIALGMLIPASTVLPMLLGGVVQVIWHRLNKTHEEELKTPLSSGLMVGEALCALIIPILVTLGLMQHLHHWLLPITTFINEKLHLTLFIGGDNG